VADSLTRLSRIDVGSWRNVPGNAHIHHVLRRCVVGGTVLTCAGIAAMGATGATGRGLGGQFDSCPKDSTLPFSTLTGAVHGFWTRAPTVYHDRNYDQSGNRVPITQLSVGIYEVFALAPYPRARHAYWLAAVRRCGRYAAANSWAFHLSFAGSNTAVGAEEVAFIVKTRHGWSLYGSTIP
jgi:hypothetical protein